MMKNEEFKGKFLKNFGKMLLRKRKKCEVRRVEKIIKVRNGFNPFREENLKFSKVINVDLHLLRKLGRFSEKKFRKNAEIRKCAEDEKFLQKFSENIFFDKNFRKNFVKFLEILINRK